MKFDVFHSVGRVDGLTRQLSDRDVFRNFFAEATAAEECGFGTMWVAESHFSSEVQKRHAEPVIPHYQGEVGLNCDSMQLAQALMARTRRLGFGTAIFNIVGGNGGPIGAADRVRTLAWHNLLAATPRRLDIGIASGRFPYINRPFGIVPRDEMEKILWPQVQQLVFVEALEIFLRLSQDEILSSENVTRRSITRALFRDDAACAAAQAKLKAAGVPGDLMGDGISYRPRWTFDPLKLVPAMTPAEVAQYLRFVLGSADPVARDAGLKFAELDVFNLSFTPPDQIERTHAEMTARYHDAGRTWHRSRMPRTVLVFIDDDPAEARERASRCFDTYMEAMRGTAKFPSKETLMERALIGDAAQIRRQLSPDDPHGFHKDDRLMLWFEFNQTDSPAIIAQMRRFANDVLPHYA